MTDTITHRGGAVRLTRALIGIAAACAACLVLIAGPAAAKTVYKYEYSGFFDGTGSVKGPFKSLGGIDYEPATEKLYVSVGVPGSTGIIDKFTKAGVPANFSALNNGAGRDFIDLEQQGTGEVSVDKSTASTAGNIYLSTGTFFGFYSNGLPIPVFNNEIGKPGIGFFGGCGATAGPNGEFWDFTDGNGQPEIHRRNLETFKAEVTYLTEGTFNRPFMCNLKTDTQGNFYGLSEEGGFFSGQSAVKLPPDPIADDAGGTAEKTPEQERRYRLNAACCGKEVTNGNNSAAHFGIDPSNDDVFLAEATNEGGFGNSRISLYDSKGGLVTEFGQPEGSYEGLRGVGGVAVDPVTHDVYVTNNREYPGEIRHVEKFVRGPSFTVPTTDTEQPTQPATPDEATFHGTVNPDGTPTIACWFEYGTTPSLGSLIPCSQQVLNGSSDIAVTANVGGLKKGTKYWVKLFSANANEVISDGGPEKFIAQAKPIPNTVFVSKINSDGATFNATVDPNGGRTWYYWEYGPTTAYGSTTPEKRLRREDSTELELPEALTDPYDFRDLISGLEPGSPVHFRLVAKNEQGTAVSSDQEFITYVQEAEPSCPNSLVRQQTGSALLFDCRAYELASTSYSGGHDVVSSTTPGQEPLTAYPGASGRVLYSLDSAAVPGVSGDPTNLGRDPYVAVRGENGWTTQYVGLPSGGMADPGSFGSPLLEADNGLRQFAFGGEGICDPCFSDGSTNIPLRRSNGALEKGMAGSLNPAANPAGEVRRRFSSDASTFVFGAEKRFEEKGNEGSVSIYSRNPASGTTRLVSTMPNGSTMTGGGIAELDISANGDRVLIGKRVSEDSAGNEYFDLYMHEGESANSVQVVDSPSGVIFDGMTSDGSKVFFTTPDQLASDSDSSNDLYVADVGASSTLTRLSTGTGGTGNTDSCEPISDWNVLSGGPNCGIVAMAGGAGIARGNGTAYFVSPELLDGASNGELNQANLYVVEPGGSPHFVAVIDSSLVKPGEQPPNHPVAKSSFASALKSPESMAVDQDTGDVYVLERGFPQGVSRFDSAGNPKPFTAGPNAGSNKILTEFSSGTAEAQVAFDNSGGPFDGDFYVSNYGGNVKIYAASGEQLGTIEGFSFECGVAVDESTGALYVGDYGYGGIRRLMPISGTTPVSAVNYTETSIHTQGMNPCQVAADTAGNVYASQWSNGPTKKFEASSFSVAAPSEEGVGMAAVSSGIYADPETDDIYIDERTKIGRFDAAGSLVQVIGSSESLGSNSRGVAINGTSGHIFATNASAVVEFGIEPVPYEPIDNPAVIHGVKGSGTHSYADFQVTPDGRYAVFSSVVPLTGYKNQGHSEVYRYDSQADALDCASCAPTLAPAQSDVTLTPSGLNMTDDGRVFFTTKESYVLRDTNGRGDAYEWSDGRTQLISTGLGPADSALLSVSADGKDAYFFTRDVLTRQDGNGNAIKIYDARENGGFLFEEDRKPCAASDECHGAGTAQPGPPNINTATGEGRSREPFEAGRCDSLASRAKTSSRRAGQLARLARRSSSSQHARKLRKRSKRAARQARKLRRKAEVCRRSSGGGSK
ncbi:MAG TPA: hypothetical protein VGF04_06615 [Solirubrobacterales bacterium]